MAWTPKKESHLRELVEDRIHAENLEPMRLELESVGVKDSIVDIFMKYVSDSRKQEILDALIEDITAVFDKRIQGFNERVGFLNERKKLLSGMVEED